MQEMEGNERKKLKFFAYSPMFGTSHTTFMGKLADSLIDEGHEVIMLSPKFYSRASQKTKARVIEFPQCAAARAREEDGKKEGGVITDFWHSKATVGSWKAFRPMKLALIEQCREILSDPQLLQQLRDEQFDAGFTETVDFCGVVLFHLLGIRTYALTKSLPSYEWGFAVHGAPAAPSYVPGLITGFSERMSFWERWDNLRALEYAKEFIVDIYGRFDAMVAECGIRDFPGVGQLLGDASFVFLNTDPLFDFPRPTVHKVLEIGGITVDVTPKKLDETWDQLLSLRPQTVLLSFGSIIKSSLMPIEWKKTIITVFQRFPEVTFLWKYEEPEDPFFADIGNVVAVKWVPQVDLLHDPRLTLFITHAGMGSVNEALLGGMPMLIIPVIGDQHRNAQLVKRMESGAVFSKFDLSSVEKFEAALVQALNDEGLKEAAKKNAAMLRHRPFAMREIFVRNMEFMGRYGPLRVLNHYGRKLSFAQYYNLDVLAVRYLVPLTALVGTAFVVRKLLRSYGI